MSSRWLRNGFIYLLILVAVVAIVYSFFGRSDGAETKDFSQVIADAKAGVIDEIVVSGDTLTVTPSVGPEYKSRKEEGSSIVDLLREEGVKVGGADGVQVQVKKPGGFGNWFGLVISFLPLLILGAILIFFLRQ